MAIKPLGSVKRIDTPIKAFGVLHEPQIEIAAWCPDLEAKAPPEQVHFIIHWPASMKNVPPMALRFKGPDTIGFFIEELIKYRRLVWPNSQKVTGE